MIEQFGEQMEALQLVIAPQGISQMAITYI